MAKILIIEDDDQLREALSEILKKEKYEVTTAENGKIGIQLYKKNPFDLIITDIIMPEKEGIETIREIKLEYPDVKIIAISGGGKTDPKAYLRIAIKLGAQKVLQKPFRRNEILSAVEALLNN